MEMEIEVSTRDLRNHTAKVLDDVEAGSTVFITRNGRRVAALTALSRARHPANERLLAYLDATEPHDTGFMQWLFEEKRANLEIEAERARRIGLE